MRKQNNIQVINKQIHIGEGFVSSSKRKQDESPLKAQKNQIDVAADESIPNYHVIKELNHFNDQQVSSLPNEEQKAAGKIHLPPKRDRPQSNVNFVKSKLSSLFQGSNILNQDNNSDSETEKNDLSESISNEDENQSHEEEEMAKARNEQGQTPILNLKKLRPMALDSLLSSHIDSRVSQMYDRSGVQSHPPNSSVVNNSRLDNNEQL